MSLSDKKSFVRQEPTCPASAGDFSPKSKNLITEPLYEWEMEQNKIIGLKIRKEFPAYFEHFKKMVYF